MILRLVNSLLRVVYEQADYVFYTISPETQPQLAPGTNIHTYTYSEEGLKAFDKIFGKRWLQPLYYRLRSGQAKLITLEEDDEIIAYGWIQSWQPFRQKFGRIFPEATMLGPYWTHPKHRGKGLYKKLLHHSLTVCPDLPVAIYTSPSNLASQKGIEGAGFKLMGTYRVQFIARQWAIVKKLK